MTGRVGGLGRIIDQRKQPQTEMTGRVEDRAGTPKVCRPTGGRAVAVDTPHIALYRTPRSSFSSAKAPRRQERPT